MTHDAEKTRIVRNVVAAIATAGGVIAIGLGVASTQEGRDVTPDTHERIHGAVSTMRRMGLSDEVILAEIERRTGTENAPDKALLREVAKQGMGSKDRHPDTINSVALVMATPVAQAAGFDAIWVPAYCHDLQPVKDGDDTVLYDRCVADQTGKSLGPLLCLADGTPAGHVTRIQATPALAERARALAGEVPVEWVACPSAVE